MLLWISTVLWLSCQLNEVASAGEEFGGKRGCLAPAVPPGTRYKKAGCENDTCLVAPGERLPSSTGLEFLCDEGYTLPVNRNNKTRKYAFCRNDGTWSAEINCVNEMASAGEECGPYDFKCVNAKCIDNDLTCDGGNDCGDGSDETYKLCHNNGIACPPNSYRCNYGACVPKNALCNGINDCNDKSDELDPQCLSHSNRTITSFRCNSSTEFPCGSDECIPAEEVCDGFKNCKDGSDETLRQCMGMKCPPQSFSCQYGACIDAVTLCSTNKQMCADNSDEFLRRDKCPEEAIESSDVRSNGKQDCLAPAVPPGTRYKKAGCENDTCLVAPGDSLPSSTGLEFLCDEGYTLPVNRKNKPRRYAFCRNYGTWSAEINCVKACKPLFSDFLDLTCYNVVNEEVSCSNTALINGTTVKPTCKPFYQPKDNVTVYSQTDCMEDGQWADPLFKCIPDCGKAGAIASFNKLSGAQVKKGDFPWAAGLYRKDKDIYIHICSGTIISYNLIITAAHCIIKESSTYFGSEELIPASQLEVAVGKYNVAWDVVEHTEQKIGVRATYVPGYYKRKFNRYDIAVLELTRHITLNEEVHPACIDWSMRAEFVTGEEGYTFGWGSQGADKGLKGAMLYYKDKETCWRTTNLTSEVASKDKFCADSGDDDSASMLRGNGGSGFTFIRNDQHYLFGIRSILPETPLLVVYTNITDHMSWLVRQGFGDIFLT